MLGLSENGEAQKFSADPGKNESVTFYKPVFLQLDLVSADHYFY